MSSLFRAAFPVLFLILLISERTSAAEFFVAPAGDDTNPGSIDKPFATIHRAQQSATPGDTVYMRGGTYAIKESQVAKKQRIWAYVITLDKSGAKDKPIRYLAYKDEKPIFDLSLVKPEARIDAFFVTADWIHIRGLEVVGVQVTLKNHTQSICFENAGSHNVFEQLRMHDGQAIGYYSTKGADNLVLNCDAWNNWDYTSENGKGGNVDGFGCHPAKGSTGNVLRGCRAWFNSDDGFDCINSAETVTFENCVAAYNGYSTRMESLGDGNGFKAGGYGSTPVDRLPNPIPRHVVRNCVAVGNKANGFYSNHHLGGSDWTNNTAYRNGANFNMLCREKDNKTDVDGYGHKLRNNLSFKPRGKSDIAKFDAAKCQSENNSWDLGLKLTEKDFASIEEKEMFEARQADGSLPRTNFLRPTGDSPLRKGIGAFE
jgi:hypothetical protein